MAAAAVSCSLMSRGCLYVHSVSAPSEVVKCSGGSVSLVWDPLQTRQAILRSSKSSYLSSSASSASIVFSRNLTKAQTSSRLRLGVPRASNSDDEELEIKVENHDRAKSNVVESSETGKNILSQFLTAAAKPAVVALMLALLLAQPTEDAFAASSGGRVGGKAFSKPSAPSRSYSGGGGGGRGYSGGGGLYAPPIYGSPYGFSPFGYSPFYGGGYGGGFFLGPSIGFGGGGTIILAMIAFATLRAIAGFVRDRFSGDDDDRFDD